MPRAKKKERSLAMYEHIAALNSVEECCRFFDDLCAVTELRAMEQRFDVAKMLHAGKVYTTILQETGASSATVSRVNRMLNYGRQKHGGQNEGTDVGQQSRCPWAL